ncbi:MAG: acyltransferase [Pseudomonadota bacterium]
MTDKNRMVWLDSLRLWAGVSMVGLHASSDINGQPFPGFSEIERIGPVLFRAIVYTARTELFLIISLFLLIMSLDRRARSYDLTIKEQSRRLLVPFAFWVVFFAFYRLIKASYFGYADHIWAELSNPVEWISYFILGSVQYHMHFLPTLFGLVLLYPLYQIAVNRPWLGLVVLMCLFTKREIDLWIWAQFADFEWFGYLLRSVKILTYAGYGIVAASFYGLYRNGMDAELRKAFLLSAAFLAVLMFSIKLVYSHKVILTANWQYNYDPAFWADFLMPICLFLLFMCASPSRFPPILSKLAPYSFGIYLVHPIFLDLLEIAFWDQKLSPSLFVATKTLLGIIAASALTYGLSRSLWLGWTVGLGPLPSFGSIKRKNLIEEKT